MSTLPRDPDAGAPLRVLILEDNPDDAELILRELRRGGFEPVWERVETAEDFSAALTHEWDVILTDFSMPHFNAFGALDILEGRQNAPPCIVVSGTIGEDTAVAAIKAGAADYIMKDRLARLAATIRRELRDRAIRRLHEAEQRRAQEAIQTLFTAIEQTVDSIMMTDGDGRITYANSGFQRLYGYSKEEITGKTPRILKSGEHDAAYYRAFWASLISGAGFRGEVVNRTKDGCLVTAEMTASAIFDETGKRTGYIAVHHDITEKKRAAEALRRSEKNYRDLVELTHDLIWAVDNEGRITYMSPASRRIYDRDPEEMIGRLYTDFLPPDEILRQSAELTRAVTSGDPTIQFESRIYHRDGHEITLSANAVATRDEKGKIIGMVGMSQDITKRKMAEDELRESQKQLRALSAHLQTIREDERTGIARELHDELGQSLTALKMDLVAMKNTLASELEEARRAAAEKIAKTVELVDGMVGTVRRISSELRPGMLDDLGLFPAIEWLAQDFSQRTGISVRIASEIGSVDLDRGQSTAIFRIFQETLTNVARHSKATEVSGLVRESGGAFELEIRDNGKGFPLSILHEASSLGLIGMRERAGSVGGSIEFVSKPGGGTTVRLRVPLRGKDPS